MEVRSICIFMVAAMLSVVTGEKCGYVRGPLAATKDTVVIDLDCKQSTPSSHYVPLQLRDNATHVAVQLVHCHTVPVGLFTNITDNLTSLTVASEDTVNLLEGTFEGLGQLIELRLLGFAKLKNLSRSVLEPLRNIHTLILDGFGRANIELPYLGSVLQKLSGTPIRRLVLNKVKDNTFFQQIMPVDNFHISNASVKELIITDVAFSYEGSIRRAFPNLTCFFAEGRMDGQIAEAYPAVFDLLFLSEKLKELVLCRPKRLSALQTHVNIPFNQFVPSILRSGNLYPDLIQYLRSRTVSEDCALGFKFKIGKNLSKFTVSGFLINFETEKPICIEEDNNLVYVDFSGTHVTNMPLFIGYTKLKYLILENTGIRKFPNTFLKHFPSLKILKLSKLDIGNFLNNTNGDFFGSRPTLADIYLDNCNITNIPTTIFSRSINLQHLDMSNNHLGTFDFDLQNCTRLNILNFSRNNIESVSRNRTIHLSQLASRKPKGNNLVVDLTENRLHCLCNSTHFIRWLQRLPTDSNIKFPRFDSYTCLYPNGSIVRVSEVVVSELEQQCSVLQTLVNGSDCPCDEETRRRVEQVWMSLDGFFCRNDAGDLVTMNSYPLPSCFNAYLRASFIAPVAVGGVLGIAVLITVGLLIYYRNSRRVKQVRECLEMNPVHFVRTALQYVMMNNRAEDSEPSLFRYDMFVFVQDDDQSSIHTHFSEALQGERSVITRDNIGLGTVELDKTLEYISVCQWFVPVLTSNFLTDPVCKIFMSKIQFNRFSAVIPVVWELSLDVRDDASIKYLLQTGEPLYWPGDLAAAEERRNFWSSLLERTIPPQ